MQDDTLLIVADSERDANMRYAVRIVVQDPFIYLRLGGKSHIVVSDQEIDRARAQADHCQVHSLSAFQQRLRRRGSKHPKMEEVIALLLKDRKIRKVLVPQSFPHGIAQDLKRHGFKVKARKGLLFPAREVKTGDEIKKISAALAMAEVGLAEGIHALRLSKADKKRQILYHGSPLTAERLRGIIDTAIVQSGGIPGRTIVACGRQSSDPCECGAGALQPHQPIILEVSPHSQQTGYYGKITRTVVKGRAPEGVRALFQIVSSAQELACSQLAADAEAGMIHRKVADFLAEAGFRTRRMNGKMQGLLHETGHGVGLERHEPPNLAFNSNDRLAAGHVLTIKPGLYYSESGGVRLEDTVCVTKTGWKNLTQAEKVLEL